MKLTKEGKALYMHCLPADITGVSCEAGEVEASVFDRYREPLYKEAGFKPYIIAAMMFLSKVKDPKELLEKLEESLQGKGLSKHSPKSSGFLDGVKKFFDNLGKSDK